MLGERLEQGVAAGLVPLPDQSQVPLEGTRGEHPRQGELGQRRAGQVEPVARLDQLLPHAGGATSQPIRIAGASVLETLPRWTTRSGASTFTAATGGRS